MFGLVCLRPSRCVLGHRPILDPQESVLVTPRPHRPLHPHTSHIRWSYGGLHRGHVLDTQPRGRTCPHPATYCCIMREHRHANGLVCLRPNSHVTSHAACEHLASMHAAHQMRTSACGSKRPASNVVRLSVTHGGTQPRSAAQIRACAGRGGRRKDRSRPRCPCHGRDQVGRTRCPARRQPMRIGEWLRWDLSPRPVSWTT